MGCTAVCVACGTFGTNPWEIRICSVLLAATVDCMLESCHVQLSGRGGLMHRWRAQFHAFGRTRCEEHSHLAPLPGCRRAFHWLDATWLDPSWALGIFFPMQQSGRHLARGRGGRERGRKPADTRGRRRRRAAGCGRRDRPPPVAVVGGAATRHWPAAHGPPGGPPLPRQTCPARRFSFSPASPPSPPRPCQRAPMQAAITLVLTCWAGVCCPQRHLLQPPPRLQSVGLSVGGPSPAPRLAPPVGFFSLRR